MKLMQKVIMVTIVLVLASCAPMQPRFPEIQTPPERISQKGYSLVPLNETGWMVVGRNPYQLGLAKRGDKPDETFGIQTALLKLPLFKNDQDLIRFIKEGQVKNSPPPRFKITKHEVTVYPGKGTVCGKSHMVTEDHAAATPSGKTATMVLEAAALICPHPQDKTIALSVTFSQRYYPEQGDPMFFDKATRVFNSIEFSDL